MNKAIISLFILFVVIVFFSSLQTISHNKNAASNLKLTPTIILEQATSTPSPVPTAPTTLISTATTAPVQLPQFKVTRPGEGSDN